MTSWYKGDGRTADQSRAANIRHFAEWERPGSHEDPAAYILTGEQKSRVTSAVNTSLALGMPLLVGGKPGSGKTQLGYSIAHELALGEPLLFVTGSTSVASDLFYRYDAVRHFRSAQASQIGGDADPRPFMRFCGLGEAILKAMRPEDRQPFIGGPTAPDWANEAPIRSVVVIDEVDKAPQDFPNDLLSQLATLRFDVPELGGIRTPVVQPKFYPVVIITTNSERQLPDAFLRRCAYVFLKSPEGDALKDILLNKFQKAIGAKQQLLEDVVRFHKELNESGGLEKEVSTAEILQFFQALLLKGAKPELKLSEQPEIAAAHASLLGKTNSDSQKTAQVISAWLSKLLRNGRRWQY